MSKLPEGGSVDFVIKFTTRNQKPGKKRIILPINVKGSGCVQILLLATICLPDIELSCQSLSFDRVYLGCSRKMFFRIENTTPVPAVWSIKTPAGARDESRFKLHPAGGTLRYGKKQLISVEFIPSEVRKHSLEVTIKIEQNAKNKVFTLRFQHNYSFYNLFIKSNCDLTFSF